MSSYYNSVIGNLFPGDIAKSEDINHIQQNIKDSLKGLLNDHHEFQSYILGGRENDFILTPANRVEGRYLDTYSIPTDGDLIGLSLREYNYRQPIAKTKSSVYSIITKMGNNTPYDVPVTCELQDAAGNVIRSDTVVLKNNLDKVEYEFLFDLRNEPTAFGLDMEAIKQEDGRHIPPDTSEGSYKEGVNYSRQHDSVNAFTAGVNQLYVVIKAIQIQINDLDANGRTLTEQLGSNSFLLYADKNGAYGGLGNMYLEQGRSNSLYEKTPYALYFKDVYATDINYVCSGGEAIIGGEKVICQDSHVTISGSSEYGNVLTLVYMDASGHLRTSNSKASVNNRSTNLEDWERETSEPLPPEYLLIAKVLVYSDPHKEPLLIQDDTTQETRPRSHHERLRRLEKHIDWVEDIAIPPRLKYTLTGDDWVDTEGDMSLMAAMYKEETTPDDDADKTHYYMTLDGEGHLIVKSTAGEVTVASVTFMNDPMSADTTRFVPAELEPDVNKTTTKTTTTTTGDSSEDSKTSINIGRLSGDFETEEERDEMWDRVQEMLADDVPLQEIANELGLTLDTSSSSDDEEEDETTTEETTTETEIIVKTAIDRDVTTDETDAIFKNYEKDDLRKLNRIAELKNMLIESKTGTITLRETSNVGGIGMTDEEAAETTFNPWDDSAENRPADTNIEPISRQYTVVSRKDGENDWDSEFPAMTFYTDCSYTLTGLTIPITKFENCSAMRFYIWKRQGPNDKDNTVWFEERIYTSQDYSLENARTDDKYQYMDDGFTIEFEDEGLHLEEGQYVIVCLPIPKEGEGSCWVDTYKPENSKDFCIRYYGAANASHFLLKERYQEIWYNAASATGIKGKYESEGHFVSGTITLKDDMAPIKKVRTSIGKNEIPAGCSIIIYGDTGYGWQKLNTDVQELDESSSGNVVEEGATLEDDGNSTTMKGNRMTFRWKATFIGDGENTPKIEFDEEKNYAIQFTLVHESPAVGDTTAAFEIDKNNCLTSKPLDGDGILREYVGDPFFDLEEDRVSNFEFARVWAKKQDNPSLRIDLSGSDVSQTIKDSDGNNHKFSAYSLHYADLKLKDFAQTSVDYSNYEGAVEPDEHNMRLKLDTENSYNDNDIQVFDVNKFETITDVDDILKFGEAKEVTIPNKYAPGENKLLYRLRLQNPIDLTKFTGVKVALKINKSSTDTSISGLGVYLSSQYEDEVPSNITNDPQNVLVGGASLLEEISKKTSYNSLVAKYKDKIIKIGDGGSEDGLKASTTEYYRYIAHYDESTNGLVYDLTLLHDIKNYYIYRLGTITADVEDKIVYQEIEIDQDSTNLKYVKEVGVVLLGDQKDEEDADILNVVNNVTISLEEFKAIENDYYPVFNPAEFHELVPNDPSYTLMSNPYTIRKQGEIEINTETYGALGLSGEIPGTFSPAVNQIHFHPKDVSSIGETICYFPNKFATKGYRHIGIQIASDIYLPKYSLRLNLCSDTRGQKVVDYVDIPTLNYIYVPNREGTIPLTQVFKKIEELDTEIKSLSISTTENFKTYTQKILANEDDTDEEKKKYVNIFIGKIILYKARTIPFFHKKMRMKFYDGNGNEQSDGIMIRKIGVVLNYR